MKKVYLIYPSQNMADYRVNPAWEYKFERKPSLGLLYLAASLEKHGIDSEVLDQSVDPFSFQEVAEKVRNNSPLLVGIYTDRLLKSNVLSLIRVIKEFAPEIKIAVGGPGSIECHDFHSVGCDIVCFGEGEITICDIVDYCLGKKRLPEIKGISFLDNGEVIKNQPRDLIQDLDKIPFPSRDKIKLNEYYDYHIFGMKKPYTTVITSRGCPFRCSFCVSHEIWRKKYRLRTPVNVVEEIDELVNKYKVRYIGFKDDIFGFNTNWVYAFVEEMKKRKLKVSFSCMLHPFSFKGKRREMLTLLKGIGLDIIIPGLQSTDEKVLTAINRHPEEPHYLEEMIREAKKLSISTVVEFIFGLPGDSPQVFRKNFNYAIKVKPHYVLFYSLSKLPGSEITREYGDRNVTGLPEDYIKDQARKCQKSFYLHPAIIFQNSLHILAKNPGWYLHAARHLSYVLRAAAIVK